MMGSENQAERPGNVDQEDAARGRPVDAWESEEQLSPFSMTLLTIGLESLLLVIAFSGSMFFHFYDLAQPPSKWLGENGLARFLFGCLLALPLFGTVVWGLPCVPLLKRMMKSIEDAIAPLFQRMSFYQMVLISIFSGVGEEVFFRWFLLGGLSQYLSWWAACGIASLIFGVCHYLNFTYFLLTTLMGVLLAAIYLYGGLLAAVACHATYDVLALWYLKQKVLRHAEGRDEPVTDET